jgi:hypothetical protein
MARQRSTELLGRDEMRTRTVERLEHDVARLSVCCSSGISKSFVGFEVGWNVVMRALPSQSASQIESSCPKPCFGLVALLPTEGARFVPPAVVGVPEGRGRLHPHEDLMQQDAVALEDGGDRRLLDVGVPHVDRGVVFTCGRPLASRRRGTRRGP